ncbi:SDR family NAD(P)-dependent oxidoreductase [Synechococcus sp. CS-1328]|uniref:SDR family NAD(P)-dependent oxidoreductase n=1 Tax=Synechococcus sp. CS-1328 TaxID=2847976 RepID=UPI00223C2D94|nr:SDR family oxidoreductase [Synechococcus sp. CS-1328]MCT0226446.1 SDR family oxidoreductase [Synechococcus sp. CS-1328]
MIGAIDARRAAKHFDIQVNAICPTVILTDMGHAIWDQPDLEDQRMQKEKRIPLHRFGEPMEVADVALFLASAASDFVHGVSLPLDGGMSIDPYWYLEHHAQSATICHPPWPGRSKSAMVMRSNRTSVPWLLP